MTAAAYAKEGDQELLIIIARRYHCAITYACALEWKMFVFLNYASKLTETMSIKASSL